MNELDTPEGKLLYLVYEMHQRGEISQRDRGILKGPELCELDMIVNANPSLLDKYREYNNNGTELTLKNGLRSLVWNKKHESTPIANLEDNATAEVSSASSNGNKKKSIVVRIPIRSIQHIPER